MKYSQYDHLSASRVLRVSTHREWHGKPRFPNCGRACCSTEMAFVAVEAVRETITSNIDPYFALWSILLGCGGGKDAADGYHRWDMGSKFQMAEFRSQSESLGCHVRIQV